MKNLKMPAGLIIVVLLMLAGCRNGTENGQPKSAVSDSVPAFILQKTSFSKKISFPGELIPFERAEVFAKISGYVNSVKADIGDHVKKGEVVATLDAPEMIAGYSEANSGMQSAKSKYLQSLDEFRRILNASRIDGTVSAGELERSRNRMKADSAALEASVSAVAAYGKLNDYLVIRAPFGGIVTQRNFDPGTLIGTANTKPLLVIENNEVLRLRLAIPEAYTSANPVDLSVSFTVDAFPGQVFEAKLSRKAGALNLINRTETWEFIYSNKENILKSGMYANAIINFSRPAPSFVVPATSVATTQEKRFIIRLKAGKAEWIDVHTGISLDDKTEIFGNLSDGDTILTRGTDEIKRDRKFIPKFQSK
jgi:membrane fusion protein, multidrug efflux system